MGRMSKPIPPAPAAGPAAPSAPAEANTPPPGKTGSTGPQEIGGPPGPEPTRFGDWEKNGRCVDF
ncbi:MAG: DUF1674 domain-containing protein [Rhodospirillaceae bacterium]|nr:DUF1674 domain-containing protein [Rhodospirillaceae bacterium]